MKVKALNTFVTDVAFKKGEIKDMDEDRANYFIRMGLVEEVKEDTGAISRDTKEEKTERKTK